MQNVVTPSKKPRTGRELELDRLRGKEASLLIKKAMKSRGIKSPELAMMLTEHGRGTSSQGVRNKLSTGNFKAAWFLDVLHLLKANELLLEK